MQLHFGTSMPFQEGATIPLAEHAEAHRYFFTKLAETEGRSLNDSVENELLKFLCDRLKEHILGDDKRYAEYILSGASIVRTNVPK